MRNNKKNPVKQPGFFDNEFQTEQETRKDLKYRKPNPNLSNVFYSSTLLSNMNFTVSDFINYVETNGLMSKSETYNFQYELKRTYDVYKRHFNQPYEEMTKTSSFISSLIKLIGKKRFTEICSNYYNYLKSQENEESQN